ncbi:meiosis-specific nuclear structural protein 1-like [Teleopsis dalmanni]|uniref:meiosis-specific nuclear structural protein 1-like n=1 Tax=Teleopsis dalmanni TaxID=139649 RepID=UPI0018CEF27D|nr:meiosis-specific nuclear structural protein 1-like [Teleopsis dalmanni]
MQTQNASGAELLNQTSLVNEPIDGAAQLVAHDSEAYDLKIIDSNDNIQTEGQDSDKKKSPTPVPRVVKAVPEPVLTLNDSNPIGISEERLRRFITSKLPDFAMPKYRKCEPKDRRIIMGVLADKQYTDKQARAALLKYRCECEPPELGILIDKAKEQDRQIFLEEKRRQRLNVEHHELRCLNKELHLAKMSAHVVKQMELIKKERVDLALRNAAEVKQYLEDIKKAEEVAQQKEADEKAKFIKHTEALVEQIRIQKEKEEEEFREKLRERERVFKMLREMEEERALEKITRRHKKLDRKEEIAKFLDIIQLERKEKKEHFEKLTAIVGRPFLDQLDSKRENVRNNYMAAVARRQERTEPVFNSLNEWITSHEDKERRQLELLIDERIYQEEIDQKKKDAIAREKKKIDHIIAYDQLCMSEVRKAMERQHDTYVCEAFMELYRRKEAHETKNVEDNRTDKIYDFKHSNLKLIAEKKEKCKQAAIQKMQDYFDDLKKQDLKNQEIATERLRILKKTPYDELCELPKGVLTDDELLLFGVPRK